MLYPNQLATLGVQAPQVYTRLCELKWEGLEPWRWLTSERLTFRMVGFTVRYPGRKLVPFAERQDCDDVACWDINSPGMVIIIHDFADDGHETRACFESFRIWLHQALDDCMDFI